MRVAVGPDQGGDVDAIAADVFDEVCEDRKTGDDVEAILGVRGDDRRCEQQTYEPGTHMSANVSGLNGSRRAASGAPHHEGLGFCREIGPHPEEPAEGGRLEGCAAKSPWHRACRA